MSKVLKRLTIFFLGIPIVTLICCLDILNHLPLNACVCAFSIIATHELYSIIKNKNPLMLQNKALVVILSSIVPISATLLCCYRSDWIDHSAYIYICAVLVAFAFEVKNKEDFSTSILKLATSAFIIFYCGYLITFITRLTIIENSSYFIILFLLMVFLCDSTAWLTGMTLGKSNRGFIKASPNKSIAGFCGGYIGSIGIGIIACFVLPEIYGASVWKYCILGFMIATSSIFGDLVESVIKRSLDTKDSGSLILGRGGVLDSIDSIIFSAPIFYITWHFLFDL